jgi:phosphatidylserine/phosphatidylglycerophosphate/cardiolipin synthase-like enzyme
VATGELERLRDLVRRNVLSCPLGDTDLRAEGFDAAKFAALRDLDRASLECVLEIVIADRANRPPPHLELVWTGPETRIARSRDTAVLVRELFKHAKTSVLIAGFSFDHGKEIFEPLHAAMSTRGVRTEIFLDVRDSKTNDIEAHVRSCVDKFLGSNWPFGPPFPDIYYDPRTAEPYSTASLHAKCIVVDLTSTLITSANFTDRGQTRNVELGVLIEDREFATQVAGQWRSLLEADLLSAVPR